ncbi:hypothetical protein GCM10011507_08420 [Edaphobacter acidisoli]|uniref:Uncharacterized protein n=1 Tax=Edaphobacter acidisoli TaxID=2040573 RepID=A0A916RL77_9BACT|nr:hypothetical protein GCM10011507_08420 [Edaphobacter acidisoli]
MKETGNGPPPSTQATGCPHLIQERSYSRTRRRKFRGAQARASRLRETPREQEAVIRTPSPDLRKIGIEG